VSESLVRSYQVDGLKLDNQIFQKSDFIFKFIELNKKQFRLLHLKQVVFKASAGHLINFFGQGKTKIT
jgi:hypothetical protein